MSNEETNFRKEQVAALYNRVARTYGRIGPDLFTPFGQWLVELMHLSSGAHVLDVATGRGAILFAAAEQVGPAGYVVGIDIAEQMVHETEVDIQRRMTTNASVQQMDAEHLAFPDASFDTILCGYALFFFPNIKQVFTEFYRVLRPGGTLGISIPFGGDERWTWYTELLETYHKQYHFSLDQGGSFLTSSTIISLLNQVGFGAIEERSQSFEFVYENAEDWWQSKWAEAARFPLERIPPDVLKHFKDAVFKRMESLTQPDGLHYRRNSLCFLATKQMKET